LFLSEVVFFVAETRDRAQRGAARSARDPAGGEADVSEVRGAGSSIGDS
jgi:hypothetical protein